MFKVPPDSIETYFAFDPVRRTDLESLDRVIRQTAPGLEPHFHAGTPLGTPGMRMKMIGYGRAAGKGFDWPVIGVALQKNYISVYITGVPGLAHHGDTLGALRTGHNNFSFKRFGDLDAVRLKALIADIAATVAGPARV